MSASRDNAWKAAKASAAREGVSSRTIHHWIQKGAVEKTRLAPATGVRVRIRTASHDDDPEREAPMRGGRHGHARLLDRPPLVEPPPSARPPLERRNQATEIRVLAPE